MSRDRDRRNQSLRRFYSMGEVEAITSLSRSTLYRKMKEGTFPRSVSISTGRVGWERRAVDEWCEQRLREQQVQRG
jgi:prophage regulatory protein